ncbi:NAD-dependent epimerase/dehydratase family protein [Micromonospora carbonacea]|uniref:NAD-dependent epimerase/dehydratase family protein n=1 Tax=Micromonospora carbonacea TaxID=47853 RepID=A0A7H8XIZ8_9ACTN|nr:NAD-dependent epimerase/dehydratase family protein [Micromonospora carbonacea]QLD23501.1 NAD-dependent epimerase/dehydratase family protein [Micromonospora carbonacea]
MTDRPLIAVLGASGFVGSAVLTALADRPVTVRAVSRRSAVAPEPAAADFEVVTADLTETGAVAAAVEGADAVINLVLNTAGWRSADGDGTAARVNLGVVRDLVEVARAGTGPRVVVFAGSASQVGRAQRMPVDGTEPDHPETGYDRQKAAAEALLDRASADGILRGVTLRLPTVFGPARPGGGDDRGVVSTMIRRALAGEPLTMWHDGTIQRELLYVDDAASAFVAALDHADALVCRHWPLGSRRGEPVGDLFRTIAALVAEETGRPPVPVVSVAPPASARQTDFHSLVVDASAFTAVTGWRAQVDLLHGLRRTVRSLSETRLDLGADLVPGEHPGRVGLGEGDRGPVPIRQDRLDVGGNGQAERVVER